MLDDDGYIRYYVDGKAVAAGIVKDAEGNFYFFGSAKYATTNTTRAIDEARTNGLIPAGTYTFGADGKMVIEEEEPEVEAKNGLIEEDGELYYYVDGVRTYAGLILHDGAFYYINSSGKAVRNITRTITAAKTNGLLPAGIYTFDENGKMVDA